jgi:hypothetical protein
LADVAELEVALLAVSVPELLLPQAVNIVSVQAARSSRSEFFMRSDG